MDDSKNVRELLALAAMPVMLLVVEVIAVILAVPMIQSGYAVFEDPSSLENPVWFIVMILGFTVLLLILLKYKFKRVLQAVIWASLFLSFVYVFSSFLSLAGAGLSVISAGGLQPYIHQILPSGTTGADTLAVSAGGLFLAAIATVLLIKYPEWYVVDILGVLLAAGIASVFGISLQPVPVILLLILLAVYDAISVYRTKHMLTLAEGVIENRMPIMVVVPKKEGYSFIRDGVGGKVRDDRENDADTGRIPLQTEEKAERAAYLMGLGDLIMPAILVVSAAVFLPGSGSSGFSIPAVTTMIGSVAGMGVLLFFVSSGRPQAGLPPLNGGAIIGFLVGWLLAGF